MGPKLRAYEVSSARWDWGMELWAFPLLLQRVNFTFGVEIWDPHHHSLCIKMIDVVKYSMFHTNIKNILILLFEGNDIVMCIFLIIKK